MGEEGLETSFDNCGSTYTHNSVAVTAHDRCFYLNQAYLSMFIAGLKRGKTNRSQTATDVTMVIKQSLGSWSHMWSLGNVSGCGSTSLFGSRVGTHQGK